MKEVSSIAEVIKDSSDFILRGKNIKCSYSLADHLWPVKIDVGQISQVVQNIVVNACEVMPDGGIITITCDNISQKDLGNLPKEMGDSVRISIVDTGPGIPPNLQSKIFDPYFTTKEQGSGLGLAITHSIITKHGGVIRADSSEGKGTTFTIYLKASPNKPLEKVLASEELVDSGGQGKVMVMDDDEMVRHVISNLISRLGYEVVLAEDGHEAIEHFKNSVSQGGIDVIIMDLTIPGGMGGKEAVKEIHKLDPNAKVIVSSGYSNDLVMAEYEKHGFCGAIVKPFQIEELRKLLQQVLS